MRYLHKLHTLNTRTLMLILALVLVIGTASVIPSVSSAARGYSNRLVSAITSAGSKSTIKAGFKATAQDKNVQQGKPEPPSEVSVIQYNGPKAPNLNSATRVTTAIQGSEIEPNGTTVTATPLNTNEARITAPLYPNGDIDFYSFTAAAGDKVYAAVMTSGVAGNSTDSQLTLLASDGTTVIEFDDDNGSFAALSSSIAGATIPAAGTYYIKINDFTAGTTSERNYDLWFRLQSGSGAPTPEVEANDSAATATPLPANGWVSGTRNPAAATEQDWYSLNLNAGDTVFLSLDLDPERDGTTWNGRLGFALFGDAANQILVIDDAGTGDVTPNPNIPSEALFMTVKDAGTYYAFVDSASAAVGGPTATYHLSVTVLPAPTGLTCTTYTSTNVPVTIGPGTGLFSSTITIPGNPRIEDIDVQITLNHALMQDLDVHLRSPAGNDIGLFTDIGAAATGGQTQMDLIFDDQAGIPPAFTVLKGLQIRPENNSTAGTASTSGAYRLSSFYGENAGGTWTLDIRDDTAGANGGTLTGWSIKVCTPPPAASCPAGFTPVTVFSTDFESGDAGFTHSGTVDQWALGTPNTPATTTANPIAAFTNCNSGVNCWKTNLTGPYAASSSQDLLSAPINLAGYSAPIVITWAQRHQIETANFDHMFVDFQQVGGATPKRLYEWMEPTPISASAGTGNPQNNIGGSYGWGVFSRRADSLAGLNSELRFHLDSDSTVNFGGLAIDDVTVTACRALSADLSITKTDGVTMAVPGGSVTYTITASNAGPDGVTGATVADTFPAVLTATWTCVGAGGGTCTATGSGNINDTVNLPSGGSVTYTVTAAISASATGTLSNTATVSSSVSDPNPANNSATDTDTLTPQANLAITKTDGVTSVTAGGSVTYTITASNPGPSNAPGTMVVDTFPPIITGVTWTCVGAGGGTCTAAGSGNISQTVNLPVGGSVTFTATGTLSAAATGTLVNTAIVTAAGGVTDPTPGNNSATDSDTIISCTLTCPANITVPNTTGSCSAVVTYSAPTTSGSCGTVTCTPASGSTFNVGITTVTCSSSITGSCSFTVTVQDTQAPTIACPANISVSANVPTVVTYTTPTPTDNCAGATASCVPPSGSSFVVGTTTVTCTASDASQNSPDTTCSFTVTVQSCAIMCPGNQFGGWATGPAPVTILQPTTTGSCGTVTCNPPGGTTAVLPVGTTTVTCTTTAGPSCSYTMLVSPFTITASLTDPLACAGPGDKVNGSFTATNGGSFSGTFSVTAALSNVVGLPGMVSANQPGTVTITANSVNWTGTLAVGQSVAVNWMGQLADNLPAGTQACSTVSATANGVPVLGPTVPACVTINCQPSGPGAVLPAASEASDQKAGSVLLYNIYTSGATSGNTQNTRINLTNSHPTRPSFVHLFFVAEGCSVADSYICLTGNQTASFLASDLDPGVTGYLVAVAVDGIRGCPTSHNFLIGDEYVKFTTGHAANLGAEAYTQLAGGLPPCDGTSVTATLNFDGVSYNRVSHVLALDNVGSKADGNDTLLILNRIGGNLGTGAGSLSSVFGIFYDDAENALSYTFSGGHQFRSSLSNNFPRITPRFETYIPAGRTGWTKLWPTTATLWGMTGAAINFNANAASSSGAFNQGHNLHKLTLTNTASYIIPIFPPSC